MQDRSNGLKILHVIPSVAPCRGGPSKAIVEMTSHLIQLGHQVEIATTNDNGDTELGVELNKLVDFSGVPIRFFARRPSPIAAVREFSYSRDFTQWLSNNIDNYDLIHVHAIFSYCSSYAMYLARRRGIPYVVRPIGQLQSWSLQQSKFKKNLYLRLIERKNIEAASTVQFTATTEKEEAEQRLSLNGKVIPLGVELMPTPRQNQKQLMHELGIPNCEFTLVYLSRLHPKKGLELLLRALAHFQTIDFSLLIAGQGEKYYTQGLKQELENLGLSNKCHFLGHIEGEKKSAVLHHSDLFALTSYSENFGIAVLEAMSSGVAPLVTRGVALSEIIAKNQLGLVCESRVESIIHQLDFAFNNPERISEIGARAQEYTIKHYSWPNIANTISQLYQSLRK